MPSELKTTNLGLNKWQGHEYPQRQDFVDDNEKIDLTIGDVNFLNTSSKEIVGAINEVKTDVATAEANAKAYTDAEVANIQVELENQNKKTVAIQNGINYITAEQDTPFEIPHIEGRTLVNLLGKDGNGENTDVIISTGRCSVVSESGRYKITQTDESGGIYVRFGDYNIDTTKYYIAMAKLENNLTVNTYIRLVTSDGITPIYGTIIKSCSPNTKTIAIRKFSPSDLSVITDSKCRFDVYASDNGGLNNTVYADDLRLYEITENEYNTFSEQDFLEKYPYVDSVQHVRNPYFAQIGENLINDREVTEISSINAITLENNHINFNWDNAFTARFKQNGNELIKVKKNTDYTYSAKADNISGYVVLKVTDKNLNEIDHFSFGTIDNYQTGSFTFNTGDNDEIYVEIVRGSATGEMNVKEVMLNEGSTAKPYKSYNASHLYIPTQLAEGEFVEKVDGEYVKHKEWESIELGGNLDWVYHSSGTGYKLIRIDDVLGFETLAIEHTEVVAEKYDGKIISYAYELDKPDVCRLGNQVSIDDRIYISISNEDSGWGDSYTPTTDEIKAYFMGWKMCAEGKARTETFETGDTPFWYPINHLSDTWDSNLKRSIVPSSEKYFDYTPYQLYYKLATPEQEIVQVEGSIMLEEGTNQIEFGEGIVVREKCNITNNGVNANINQNSDESRLKNKVDKILMVYKNTVEDIKNWIHYKETAFGNDMLYTPVKNYDTLSNYHCTYTMLDNYPISSPITAEYDDNLREVVDTLVEQVADIKEKVDVTFNEVSALQEVEWFEPVLQNGWVNDGEPYSKVAYCKDKLGFVHVKGTITGGTTGDYIALFILPKGFRPKEYHQYVIPCDTPADGHVGVARLYAVPHTGEIKINTTDNDCVYFNISFKAEQ